jgi:hypothetical protein
VSKLRQAARECLADHARAKDADAQWILPSLRETGLSTYGMTLPDPSHPAHKVALAHKRQVLERFTALGREAKLRSPKALAEQLLLLMDGAWVAARIFVPCCVRSAYGPPGSRLVTSGMLAV